jgi:rubrerythrin
VKRPPKKPFRYWQCSVCGSVHTQPETRDECEAGHKGAK